MTYLPFCVLLMALAMGCSTESTEELAVRLLKEKLNAANGAVPPNFLERDFHLMPDATDKKKYWTRTLIVWPVDNQTLDVKRTDSVVKPYSGFVELSSIVLVEEMFIGDSKNNLNSPLASKKRFTVKEAKQLADIGKPEYVLEVSKTDVRLRLYYEYADRKWTLVKVSHRPGNSQDWKEESLAEMEPSLQLFFGQLK